MVMCFKSCAS